MYSPIDNLLLNESALFQHCLESAFVALRRASGSERGFFYVAFFNYSVGLERLLKVLLQLHSQHTTGAFITRLELRKEYNHDLEKLHQGAKALFELYGVTVPENCQADLIDEKLLAFLSQFALWTRFYNLDALAENPDCQDPLAEWAGLINNVYKCDLSENLCASAEEQVEAHITRQNPFVTYVPFVSMGGTKLNSFEDYCMDEQRIAMALPHLRWRLLKILVPLKELLGKIRPDNTPPILTEFLDFVCTDRQHILTSSNWPFD